MIRGRTISTIEHGVELSLRAGYRQGRVVEKGVPEVQENLKDGSVSLHIRARKEICKIGRTYVL